MKRAALLALLTLAIGAHGASAAAPKPGTFAGTLGIAVPKGAEAEVRAISRADGTVTRTKATGRSGAFSLSLPAGQYLVVGDVLPQPGKGAKITTQTVGVSLKAGQKRTKASIKRKKKKAKKRKRAGAAFVQEKGEVTPGQIAVEIPEMSGATGEYRFMNRGIPELLIGDVLNGSAGEECDVHVLEVLRRDEIIKELEFEQSEYVDPATRVVRNFILGDVEIRGTLKNGPNDATLGYDIRIVDKRSGEEFSRLTGSIDGDNFFDSEEDMGKRVSDELCKLTDTYEVTLNVTGAANFATHSAGGTMTSKLIVKRGSKKSPIYRGSGTLGWAGTSYASKIPPCSYIDQLEPTVPWDVTITNLGNGDMLVEWQPQGADNATASVSCPTDDGPPAIVPGQPGPSLIQTMPMQFQLPVAGGVQELSGGFSDGGDGWTNTGTVTVRPKGVAKIG